MDNFKINNKIIIEKNERNLKYLEFIKLNELGVKNMYSLKDVDFSANEENIFQKDNYFKLAHLFDIERKNLIGVTQTHSNNILIVKTDEDLNKSRENYDGIITNRTDIAILTKNADCILFIIYDKKKKVLGNIHSGWKGTLLRIIEDALTIFQNEFKSNLEDVQVFVSPSIRKCHFEVEEDVKSMFEKEFNNIDSNLYIKEKNKSNKKDINQDFKEKYYIDTIFLNKNMMKNLGILEENIYDSNLCSVCYKDKIYSYRGAEINEKYKRAVLVAKIEK